MVRLLTCGSVDDGKSTLIGRLLWDAAAVAEDQRAAVMHASQNRVVNGEKIDFSLLLDGLQAEREQGITIDIAWRYFETVDRRFVIIDAPGHEQYTRNMATGASHADVAILLVDARHGAKRQTRRHAAICNLVGIKNVVLAVNKMDLIDWSEARFRAIEADFATMAQSFGFSEIAAIPVAALPGDNVMRRSRRCPGMAARRSSITSRASTSPASVATRRSACRCSSWFAHADFRGYAGTVIGPDQAWRPHHRCQERAWCRGAPHHHHGRRPCLRGEGRCRGAGARHRPRHFARRRALGGAAASRPMPTCSRRVSCGSPRRRSIRRPAICSAPRTDLTPVTSMSISALVDFETFGSEPAHACAVNDIADCRILLGRPAALDLLPICRPRGALSSSTPSMAPPSPAALSAGLRPARPPWATTSSSSTGSCCPAVFAPILAILRPTSPNSIGARKRPQFCYAQSGFPSLSKSEEGEASLSDQRGE